MKNRIISMLLVCVMLMASIPVFTVATGAVTTIDWKKDKEIVINTATQFVEFKNQLTSWNFSGQTIKLGDDIDLSEVEIEDRGNGYKSNVPFEVAVGGFQGTFDGQFHFIKNLTFIHPGANAGLFGKISPSNDAGGTYEGNPITVKNFAIIDSNIAIGDNSALIYWQSRGGNLTMENIYIGTDITFLSPTGTDGNAVFINNITRTATVTIKNCVYDGAITSGHNLYSVFFNYVMTETPTMRVENCLIVHDTAVPYDVNRTTQNSSGLVHGTMTAKRTTGVNNVRYKDNGLFNAMTGAAVDMPEGFTARDGTYPVPTSALPLFADKSNAPVKKYVKFMYNGAVYHQEILEENGMTIDAFPEIKANGVVLTDVIWINSATGAMVELPVTVTEDTVFVAKTPGVNESSMLGVQCGAVNNNKQSIRFIGGLYNLDGEAAGFEITVKYKENGVLVTRTYRKSVNTVYSSINATENGEIKNVSAKELGAYYLYAVVLEDVPANIGQIDIVVNTFKTVYGGKIDIPGTEMIISIMNGVVNNNLSPLS